MGTLCTEESTGPCIPCEGAVDCDPLGVCGGRDCVVGVCQPVTVDCQDTNPCTQDACDAVTGCTHAVLDATQVPECDDGDRCTTPTCDAVQGCVQTDAVAFESLRCRAGSIEDLLADDSVSEKARTSLQKLLDKVAVQVDKAEGLSSDPKAAKKVKKALKNARKKATALRKKAEKMTGGELSDLVVARAIVNAAEDLIDRLSGMISPPLAGS
jgi:hypothetical protein